MSDDEEVDTLRDKVAQVLSTDVMPHVCSMSDEEIDELCHQLFEFRRRRSASAHLVICHGLVTTGIFRSNPLAKQKQTSGTPGESTSSALIQARVIASTSEANFNAEEVYRQRDQSIQNMLNGRSSKQHTLASKGRFKCHGGAAHATRINNEVVQFY